MSKPLSKRERDNRLLAKLAFRIHELEKEVIKLRKLNNIKGNDVREPTTPEPELIKGCTNCVNREHPYTCRKVDTCDATFSEFVAKRNN